MSGKSKIEWCEATWNPVLGCSKVSPGCRGCYAINQVHRMAHNPNAKLAAANAGLTVIEGGHPNWTGVVRLIPERLEIPLRTRKPTMYFVNSLSDLFHESLSDEDIDRVFAVAGMCDGVTQWQRYGGRTVGPHVMQILTKRSRRMRDYCQSRSEEWARKHFINMQGYSLAAEWAYRGIRRAWLGVSVEDQQCADERIPELLATPVAVRFISAEPLLALVDLQRIKRADGWYLTAASGVKGVPDFSVSGKKLDWVIVGAESGPGARPMEQAWVRSLKDQCVEAGVPFFYKQDAVRGRKIHTPELDGRKWQQFPEVAR